MSHYGCANNCVCTTGFCLGLPISSLVLSFGLRLVQSLAWGVASCLLMASSNPELDPVQTREVAPTTADTWLQLCSSRKSTHSDWLRSGWGWSLSVPCPLTVTWADGCSSWAPGLKLSGFPASCLRPPGPGTSEIPACCETTLGGHLTWLPKRRRRSRFFKHRNIF